MSRIYYGWPVLGVAAAAMVGTLPGRTQGLGLITEPLLADLQIDRISYAELNFWATILGSAFALGVGRFIDLLGSRVVLTVVAVALGLVVGVMSGAATFATLAIAITLTRGLGQSALSVVSLTMVGQWFARRINTAMAIYSVVLSVGFMLAFPLVGALIQTWGWRAAWLLVGVALVLGLAPAAWLIVARGPEARGLRIDGDATTTLSEREIPRVEGSERDPGSRVEGPALSERDRDSRVEGSGRDRDARVEGPALSERDRDSRVEGPALSERDRDSRVEGYHWREALATPAFWVFAIGTALYGLVASGIGLFNESILAERGFDATVYYQTLVVTALTALAGNFLGGWLAATVPLPMLLAASLFVLTGGLAALPLVTTLGQVMAWATAMGLGGGLVMVLFFSVWPRVYGRRHLGRIQGAAQALTVLASALGPLLLAWCIEWTGSYRGMFYALAGAVASVGIAATLVRMPTPHQILSEGSFRRDAPVPPGA